MATFNPTGTSSMFFFFSTSDEDQLEGINTLPVRRHKYTATKIALKLIVNLPSLRVVCQRRAKDQEILKTFTWTCSPPNKPRDVAEISKKKRKEEKTTARKNRDLADTYLR